eukprot:CAMPEP_0196748134 /NCGR_PEP_ID=MMETSP1091-20130531/72454_1 /TAXON_ID=302021 /ORGANISM="Rhodomonas sp., Strain CCMP768" /LENGTH=79 /DNA_ID=CAMNT_0042095399 /DNA_START=28 /DNA_END=264 /DNA_ORIENTATION=+
MATFVGAHREEVLSRFANCEVPIPATELDWLSYVMYDALHVTQPELTTFFRWTSNTIHARGVPIFMRYTRKREFDANGG